MKRKVKLRSSDVMCGHYIENFGESALNYLDEKLYRILVILKESIFPSDELICNSLTNDQNGMICNLCSKTLNSTGKLRVHYSDQLLGKAVILTINRNNMVLNSSEILSQLELNSDKLLYNVGVKLLDSSRVYITINVPVDLTTIVKQIN